MVTLTWLNFVFIANTLSTLMHALVVIVVWLKSILVKDLRYVIWFHQNSLLISLADSLKGVFLGADDVVSIRIALTRMRHAFVSVFIHDSCL